MSEEVHHVSEVLSQWVIYHNPSDIVELYEQRGLPADDIYVAREWLIGPGGTVTMSEVTPYVDQFLYNVRRFIQTVAPGSFCLARAESDDPTIVETWT